MTDPKTGPTQAEIQIAQDEQQYGQLLLQKRDLDRAIEAAENALAHQRSGQLLIDAQLKDIEGRRAGVALGRDACAAEAARSDGKKAGKDEGK